ncbi:MAG TPA: DUF1015 domain-containing protein [Clostridiaceae bacterium]|nr:DUF1015 domain-containing protein [Clostridiaceae bacterium]
MDNTIINRFANLGIHIPEILLPAEDIDMTKWSVVACDQYTSELNYWNEVERIVGDNPSTLRLIYPEIFLEEEDQESRIKTINNKMKEYLESHILDSQGQCFIYLERETSCTNVRKGLILAVDLEKYDYHKGSKSLIRATEGTVLERIPPRVKIRENASIELPHIMLLIDDCNKTVIEPLADKKERLDKIYDFDLMLNGGHIRGYRINDDDTIISILEAFEQLAYSKGNDDVLLFAVGDGNHSLASAKAHWENIKSTLTLDEIACHPARFALVEVCNVHDEGIVFEPIHRVVFGIDYSILMSYMQEYFEELSDGSKLEIIEFTDTSSMEDNLKSMKSSPGTHVIPFVTSNTYGAVLVKNPVHNLEVGTLQSFLDSLTSRYAGVKVDYIHGEDVVMRLGRMENNIGFFLPSMNKHDLFKTVKMEGALPRKTFSMGEANEKRYYLECRRIR